MTNLISDVVSTLCLILVTWYALFTIFYGMARIAKKITESKDEEWLPGKDLHWIIVTMCEKIEDYSIAQIVEAAEMRITDPDLVVELEDFEPEKPYKVPMVQDRYGHPAIGHDVVGTCMCDGCDRRDPHTHEW